MTPDLSSSLLKIKNLLDHSSKIVVFTGAGISTESGISDYRSQGGLWERFQPVTIQEFLADEDKRREFWRHKTHLYAQMREAKPNAGHLAIARLEAQGKLLGVITQNIDGLHHLAGSKKILELHGTNREYVCLDCKKTGPFEEVYQRVLNGEEIPLCSDCRGLLKSNTISFGQSLDPGVLRKAFEWCDHCDLLLALGSTLIVEPAASLPLRAKHSGAGLVIINRDSTPLDSMADAVIHGGIGEILNQVIV